MAAGAPDSVVVEVNLSGSTWTALTGRMRTWQVTQNSEDGTPTGGRLDLVLDNNDGTLVSDNATSSYYPNWVEGKAIRVTVTKGASNAVVFFGWITGIEPDYPDDVAASLCQVTALDIIGIAARTKAKPMPWAAISRLRSDNAAYYPLTDRSARRGFGDLYATMPDLTVRNLGGGKVQAAGDDSFSSDADPCVTLTSGRSLWHARTAFSMTTAGTLCFLIKIDPGNTGTVMQLITRTGTDYFLMYDASVQQFTLSDTEGFGGGVLAPTRIGEDEWHCITLVYSPSNLSLTIDGDFANSVGWASGTDIIRLEIGADVAVSIRDLFIDPDQNVANDITDAYIKSTGLVASTLAEQTAFWGYILDVTPSWSSSVASVAATGLLTGGRTAFESLLALANSQSGIAYCSYTSTSATINLIANEDSRPTNSSMTIDPELDADGGPTIMRSLGAKVAEVRVVSQAGETLVRDSTAAAAFDATTIDVETALANEQDRRAVAQDRLALSQNIRQRVASITVDLVGSYNSLWAETLNLIPSKRVRVGDLPSAYFGVDHLEGYVAGRQLGGTDRDVSLTLWLLAADAPPEGRWDTDRWAFGDGVATVTSGTAVGGTGTGTIVVTWTGGAALSTSAGDYPMDFDWNGERVTVTSAPAGSSSPQTLTITARGVGASVARAHSAGEAIDIWNAARWAM